MTAAEIFVEDINNRPPSFADRDRLRTLAAGIDSDLATILGQAPSAARERSARGVLWQLSLLEREFRPASESCRRGLEDLKEELGRLAAER